MAATGTSYMAWRGPQLCDDPCPKDHIHRFVLVTEHNHGDTAEHTPGCKECEKPVFNHTGISICNLGRQHYGSCDYGNGV